jgi:hypothetical protein
MLLPNRHSWITQRIANRLPLWADARLDKYSFFQQFINPYGSALEKLYKQLSIGAKNYYASTANLDEIDVVYKVNLPRNFNFSVNDRDPANPIRIPPRVTTNIDSVLTEIPVSENNDVESFWYTSFPTRIKREGTDTDVSGEILSETQFKDLASSTLNTFSIQGRLAITVAGATEFINLNRPLQRGFVKLRGVTRKGQEEVERINFITNTTITSLKEWRRLEEVSVYGIFPRTATITIDVLPFNVPEQIDPFNLFIDEVNESVLFTEVEALDYTGTILKHKIFAATNLALLQQGFTGFDVRAQAELLDTTGDPIIARDFTIQPFQDRVFVLTDNKIYIYYNFMPYPDCSHLNGQTEDSLMVIETNKRDYIRDETVKIRTDRRHPVKRILKNRWSLTKPDGTKVRLGLDGTEWPLTQRGWIINSHHNTYNFIRQKIDYTVSEFGTYTFELETFYHDGSSEIDKHIINVNGINAEAALDLPVDVQNADGIAFDSDQNLWIKKTDPSTGIETAYKMTLYTDNMLVDFDKRIIYFHEQYDKVTIETGSSS